MKPTIVLALFLVALAPTTVPAQCALAGAAGAPTIRVTSDLWDSNATFVIENAAPNAPWIWLLDVSPGPQSTPFGPFCFTPSALFLADSFGGVHAPTDATGRASFDGTISAPGLVGFPFFMQAVVVDPSAPFNIARSASLPFTVRSPRVYVTSGISSIDVLDALGHATSTATAPVSTGSATGSHYFAVSPDGDTMFVRGRFATAPVHAFDVTTNPPTLIGSMAFLVDQPRPGITISSDGATGWFVDSHDVFRFDADPDSATFLTVTGSVALSNFGGAQNLILSPDDQFLYVVEGSAPSTSAPSALYVVDTVVMAELLTVPLTNSSQLLLGFSIREPLAVSPDGRWLATVQFGSHPFATSALNVVSIDPSSPAFLNEVAGFTLTNSSQKDIAFSADGWSIYTVDRDASSAMYLTEIDWPSGTETSQPLGINTPDPTNFFGSVATTPNRSLLYVTTGVDDQIRVFDSTVTQIQSLPLLSAGTASRIIIEDR